MDKALAKTLVSLLCAIIIVICIYGYASTKNDPASNNDIYESWVQTDAAVIGSEVIMNQNWLNIEFMDSINTRYKTKVEFSESGNPSEKTIRIRYNPNNPKEVFIETAKN